MVGWKRANMARTKASPPAKPGFFLRIAYRSGTRHHRGWFWLAIAPHVPCLDDTVARLNCAASAHVHWPAQRTYYYAPCHGPQLADPYVPSAGVLSPPDGVGYAAGGEPKKRAVNIIGLTRSIVWATGAAGGLEPTSKLLNQRAPNRHSRVHFFECHDIALPGNATEYV
jgi:hypothetical protein